MKSIFLAPRTTTAWTSVCVNITIFSAKNVLIMICKSFSPITTFSHASSTRPGDETHEQHARFTIQARIARTRADVHGEDKEKMLVAKSGERKFYFAYRSSKMQGVSRDTRRAIRETQMSYDTVVILTDGKTRQLSGASREISLTQWIDTAENTHLRGGNDYVHVFAKHKGRTTSHADLETTEGLCADPPAGNEDSHNVVHSWCAQVHVSIHSCDFTNGYFQGREIGQISLYHIPKGEATCGAILASRLSIHGTKGARAGVMNTVLQKFSTCKEQHGGKGNTVRVQPITHDARCDSTREATTSGVHQEKFNSRFLAWIGRQTL